MLPEVCKELIEDDDEVIVADDRGLDCELLDVVAASENDALVERCKRLIEEVANESGVGGSG